MTRAVLFDLDGTLVDRDSAIHELVADQYDRYADALRLVARDTFVRRILALDDHGHGDKQLAYRRLADEFGLSRSVGTTLVDDFWAAYRSFCRCFPGTVGVLSALRRRGFRLAIVTNGTVQVQEPVLRDLGIDALVDAVLISEREGIRKPDSRMFERALRCIDCRPGESWFVGDHPQVDIEGASAAGLTPIWKRTTYWPEPDARYVRIDHLEKLLAVLP